LTNYTVATCISCSTVLSKTSMPGLSRIAGFLTYGFIRLPVILRMLVVKGSTLLILTIVTAAPKSSYGTSASTGLIQG
jgi:hypothetical protein